MSYSNVLDSRSSSFEAHLLRTESKVMNFKTDSFHFVIASFKVNELKDGKILKKEIKGSIFRLE